jgi:hypothetical protein
MKKTHFILVLSVLCYTYYFAQNVEIDNKFNKRDFFLSESKGNVGRVIDYFMDSKKNIYIIESNALHKFDNNGNQIGTLSSKGGGPGEFGRLGAIIITKNDELLLEDRGNQRILKYNSNLKYLSEMKKVSVEPITSWCTYQDTLLATFCFSAIKNPITLYNIKNGKVPRSIGINSNLFMKYKAFDDGGGITVNNNFLYSIYNLEYKINRYDLNGRNYQLPTKSPSRFVTINKISDKTNPFDISYSIILNIYCIENNLYIISLPPSKNKKLSKPLCDIITLDGSMISEGLTTKYLPQSKQINSTTFIKVVDQREIYEPNDEKSKIIVRIMELK